jgi:hypothetical protein
MNTHKSETLRMKLSEIRERCRELLEEQEAAPELELEDTDDPDREHDPYNRLR